MDQKKCDKILEEIKNIPVENEAERQKQAKEETDPSKRLNILNTLREEKWNIYKKEKPEEYRKFHEHKKEKNMSHEELGEKRLKELGEPVDTLTKD